MGQISKQLKTRIAKHRNHINRNISTQFVITDHKIQYNHDFNWEEVKILDTERFLNKRLIR